MNKNSFFGTIFGQAVGDALGLGSEFLTKEEVLKYYPQGLCNYEDIIQDAHRCRWAKGDWTDDTDMMLCILESLNHHNGAVDLISIAENFKSWFNGTPLGIGRHTYNVLCFADYTKDPIRAAEIVWTLYRKRSAANGGLMRTSVVGLLKENIENYASDICRLTHPDPRCIGSCVIVSKIIHELVYHDCSMSECEILNIADKYDERIRPFVEIAKNASSIDDLELCGLEQGFTLKTLSASLWAYWHASSFEEGLLEIVNAGGDADTNAAVGCSILGAKFGFKNIPDRLIDNLHEGRILADMTESLYKILAV